MLTDPSIQPFYQSGVNVPGTPEFATFTNQEAVLKLTTVLTANLVNEARSSYQRNLTDSTTSSPFLSASAVGMTALNAGIGYDVLPRIDIGPLNIRHQHLRNHHQPRRSIPVGRPDFLDAWKTHHSGGRGSGSQQLELELREGSGRRSRDHFQPGRFLARSARLHPGHLRRLPATQATGSTNGTPSATLSLSRTLPPAIRRIRAVTSISGTGLKAPSFRTTSSSRPA